MEEKANSKNKRLFYALSFAFFLLLGFVVIVLLKGCLIQKQKPNLEPEEFISPPPATLILPETEDISSEDKATMLVWLDLNETNGQTAGNKIKPEFPGQLYNFTFESQGLMGKIDRALFLDGLDDYISVVTKLKTRFTVSIWIKIEEPFQPGTGSFGQPIWALMNLQGQIICSLVGREVDGLSRVIVSCPLMKTHKKSLAVIQLGEWQCLVVSCDAVKAMVKLYVDGAPDIELHGSQPFHFESSHMFMGTQTSKSSFYKGWVDDLRVYDIIVNPDDAVKIFTLDK